MCDFGISGYLVNSIAKTIDAGCKPYMAVIKDPFILSSSQLDDDLMFCGDLLISPRGLILLEALISTTFGQMFGPWVYHLSNWPLGNSLTAPGERPSIR